MDEQKFRFRREEGTLVLVIIAVVVSVFFVAQGVDVLVVEGVHAVTIGFALVWFGLTLWLWYAVRCEMDVITLDCYGLRVFRGKRQRQHMAADQVKTIVYHPGKHRRYSPMLGIAVLSPQELIQKELDIQNRSPLNPSGLTYGQLSPAMRKRFLLDYVARQVRRRYRADGDFIWLSYSKRRETTVREAFPQAEWFRDEA